MPRVNLTLSKTSVYLDNNYSISTETFTAEMPSVLKGATFNSVSITYDTWEGSVHNRLCFVSGLYDYLTNDALLARLQNGEVEDTFQLQLVKYDKGIAYVERISIEVDYNPASDVSGTEEFDGSSVWYSAGKRSLAVGEDMELLLDIEPDKDVTQVTVDIGDSSHASYNSVTQAADCPAGKQTTVNLTLSTRAQDLSERVSVCYMRFTLTTNDGDETSGWFVCGENMALKLVKVRNAPTVTMAWSDAEELIEVYGNLIQNKSRPRVSITAALDTAADPDNVLTVRELTLTDLFHTTSYTAGNDTLEIDELVNSGTVTAVLSVTDSYGKTGSYTQTLTVLEYLAPSIDLLTFERYTTKTDEHGDPVYVPDDNSPTVWVNINANVSPLNGLNAWTLTADPEGETVEMASGEDGEHIIDSRNRSMFTEELSEADEWRFTVTLTDQFGSVSKAIFIPKSGAILDIELTGVAVGKRSEGTEQNPLFEVAYPAVFLNGFGDGEDHGWTAMTLTNCSAVSGESVMACRRLGVVQLRGGINLNAALSSGTAGSTTGRVQIMTLPTWARPVYRVERPLLMDFYGGPIRMVILTDGSVFLENRSGTAVGTNVSIYLTINYII